MSTILEADEMGTLHLPASMLPHPGPHRRYRVATESGYVVVDEVPAQTKSWMELAGCLAGESAELRRIEGVVADEFERINPEDWR